MYDNLFYHLFLPYQLLQPAIKDGPGPCYTYLTPRILN